MKTLSLVFLTLILSACNFEISGSSKKKKKERSSENFALQIKKHNDLRIYIKDKFGAELEGAEVDGLDYESVYVLLRQLETLDTEKKNLIATIRLGFSNEYDFCFGGERKSMLTISSNSKLKSSINRYVIHNLKSLLGASEEIKKVQESDGLKFCHDLALETNLKTATIRNYLNKLISFGEDPKAIAGEYERFHITNMTRMELSDDVYFDVSRNVEAQINKYYSLLNMRKEIEEFKETNNEILRFYNYLSIELQYNWLKALEPHLENFEASSIVRIELHDEFDADIDQDTIEIAMSVNLSLEENFQKIDEVIARFKTFKQDEELAKVKAEQLLDQLVAKNIKIQIRPKRIESYQAALGVLTFLTQLPIEDLALFSELAISDNNHVYDYDYPNDIVLSYDDRDLNDTKEYLNNKIAILKNYERIKKENASLIEHLAQKTQNKRTIEVYETVNPLYLNSVLKYMLSLSKESLLNIGKEPDSEGSKVELISFSNHTSHHGHIFSIEIFDTFNAKEFEARVLNYYN